MIGFLQAQPAIVLFFILIGYLALGDIISLKTKARLPSVFIFALLVLLTSWAGLIPPDIFDLGGANTVFTGVVSLLIVVDMGTTMDIADIKKNWRVVIIGLVAILGSAAFILLLGTPIFGWEMSLISAPVVAGGIVASLEMQAAAYEAGNAYLVVIAALILAFQSFPGFILTPVMLKKAMRADLQNGGASGKNQALALETKEKFPEAYQTTAILLAITAAIGILSFATAQLTREVLGAFAISQAVWGLLYGILFSGLGWIPKGVLDKAMSSGIILILVIFSAFGVLATTTFTEIAEVAAPVLGLLALGIAGIFIFCILAAKILKLDWRLAVALGLNCLLGFPLNYQLTKESIRAITNDPEEAKYLEDKYMPMMLVAGFVTITIGSVFLAGFLRNFV